MASIEHCMSGGAEHHEARRKERVKERQAQARQRREDIERERERDRKIQESLRREQSKQETARTTDRERRQAANNPENVWYSAKLPNRYNSNDYMSQW